MTALHYAADRGFIAIVRLLISHGAVKAITDNEGQTALDYAIMCEHEDIVDYLNSL
jgi:ankyrin repeat protein